MIADLLLILAIAAVAVWAAFETARARNDHLIDHRRFPDE